MELYFIRHGQSQNNAHWNDSNYTESPDPELTKTGIAQTQILAEHLEKFQLIRAHEGRNPHNRHGFGLTHLYTSLMERAVHTAAPTAQRLPQIPFAAWPEIHESGGIFGRDGDLKLKGLPGKSRSYFEEYFPKLTLPASLDGTGWWNRPFETEEQCQLRAENVWAELLSRHGDQEDRPEQRIVFVSHGGFFVHLLCAILELPWLHAALGLKSWFMLSNCSISRIDIRQNEVTICYLNRTDHLPDSLITG